MAIVKMNKFTLLAFESQKQHLLEKLQLFQNVEFINLQSDQLLKKDQELSALQKDAIDSTYAEYENYLSKSGSVLEFVKSYVPADKTNRKAFTFEELEARVISGDWQKHYKEIRGYQDNVKAAEASKEKLKSLTNQIEEFDLVYEYYHPLLQRQKIAENFLKVNQTMLISGFIPVGDKQEFETMLQAVEYDDHDLAKEDALTGNDNYHLTFEDIKEEKVKFTLFAFESGKQQLLKEFQSFQNVEFINLQDEQVLEENQELITMQKDTLDATYAEYKDYVLKASIALELLTEYGSKKLRKQRIKAVSKNKKPKSKKEITPEEREERVISGKWRQHYKELETYKNHITIAESDLEKLETMSDQIEEIELAYEYYYNLLERQRVASNFLKTNETILMAGWLPVEGNDGFEKAIKEAVGDDYHLVFEDANKEEAKTVPIQLKNNVVMSKFESLTRMYSLPKYDEIDPTPLLAPFYLIFFGMMVADAGYGLVMFLATLLGRRFIKLDAKKKDFLQFFLFLSIPTIIFGYIYGSFFGDIIHIPGSGLIEPQRDINTLLLMSVGFGLIHIFFGLGIKAYILIREGKWLDAFFDSGSWFLTVSGAAMFLGDFMMEEGMENLGTIGMYIMLVGMALLLLTQGRKSKGVGGKIGGGLYALFGLTSYIGDIVSYTRLMALGLAGGSIASAFNLIMSYFPNAWWSVAIIAPLFFIATHAFNIFLTLLGAYVHSCRLQYVEYFGKFYEGGGKEFVPFKALEQYADLKQK